MKITVFVQGSNVLFSSQKGLSETLKMKAE